MCRSWSRRWRACSARVWRTGAGAQLRLQGMQKIFLIIFSARTYFPCYSVFFKENASRGLKNQISTCRMSANCLKKSLAAFPWIKIAYIASVSFLKTLDIPGNSSWNPLKKIFALTRHAENIFDHFFCNYILLLLFSFYFKKLRHKVSKIRPVHSCRMSANGYKKKFVFISVEKKCIHCFCLLFWKHLLFPKILHETILKKNFLPLRMPPMTIEFFQEAACDLDNCSETGL